MPGAEAAAAAARSQGAREHPAQAVTCALCHFPHAFLLKVISKANITLCEATVGCREALALA